MRWKWIRQEMSDRQGRTKAWVVHLDPLDTHVHPRTYTHGAFCFTLGSQIFFGNCCSSGSTKNSFSYLMTSAQREKNKAGAVLTASSRLPFGHTQGLTHTLANSLLCFSRCQRRLKKTEEQHSEGNKQAHKSTGGDRAKKWDGKLNLLLSDWCKGLKKELNIKEKTRAVLQMANFCANKVRSHWEVRKNAVHYCRYLKMECATIVSTS